MGLMLGKLPPKYNKKTLNFADYVTDTKLPAPPAVAFWEYKIKSQNWRMFKNDVIGDCTCAAIAHMLMCWTSQFGETIEPTEEDVVRAYSALSGYNPKTGENDNGACMTDVMEYWQTVGIAGHKIDGWVSVDPSNIEMVKLAIYLFGAVNPGIQMPYSAIEQFNDKKNWHVVHKDGGIAGGHSVPYFGYGREGTTGVTWGRRQPTSWEFWNKYVDEAYSVLSLDWLDKNQEAPNHLNLKALRADLKALGR